jgi:epsilon-lactone hydrolase
LRQGQLDLRADVAMLRVAFNDVMARIPVASDVDYISTTLVSRTKEVMDSFACPWISRLHPCHGEYHNSRGFSSAASAAMNASRIRLQSTTPAPHTRDFSPRGVDAGQIALAGESAGGGLAVAALLALRDAGTPLPSSAFLMSPYVDLTLSGETILQNQATDLVLTPEGLRLRVPDYVGGADASNP